MKGPYWQTYEKETIAHVYVFDRKTDRVTRFCDGDGHDDPDSLHSVRFSNGTTLCQVCSRFLAALRA